jgi:hypothetical protein
MIYKIYDWAGNCVLDKEFPSFEGAEDTLCIQLGDEYQEARQEYEIKGV